MKKFNLIWYFVAIVIVATVFRNWFSLSILSSGDWIYYFPESVQQIVPFSSWDSRHFGLGSSVLPTLWLEAYFETTVKVSQVIGWVMYERIFWFFPYLIFASVSSFYLYKKLFPHHSTTIFASIVFLLNTYSLMLSGGGQMGIGLAYSFTPFVFLSLIRVVEDPSLRKSLLFGIVLSVLLMFDLRVFYMFLILSGLYVLFFGNVITVSYHQVKKIVYIYGIPGLITVLLHSFWILPILITRQNPVNQFSEVYSSTGAVKFFSFAFFENTLSLLHPNWPENLFGKVYFMRPEFLVFPIVAYASLLFVGNQQKKEKNIILFFALLGLIGAFLAKGANEPFGELYQWLFQYIPGFVMFRDSSKWYLFIVLSYTVLIPYTIFNISSFIQKKLKHNMSPFYVPVLFIVLFLFTIRFTFLSTLSKTYSSHVIPQEYIRLAEFIQNKNQFFRTLWVPQHQTYSYTSELNPSISANDWFNTTSASAAIKQIMVSKPLIEQAGVRFIIVPYDSNHEIFLDDRKYSEKLYQQAILNISQVPWLRRVEGFGKIAVFENSIYSPLFKTTSGKDIQYEMKSPTHYAIDIPESKNEKLVFFNQYNMNWEMRINGSTVPSEQYNKWFNSFTIPDGKNMRADIIYRPQQYVQYGLVISGITILLLGGTLIIRRKK